MLILLADCNVYVAKLRPPDALPAKWIFLKMRGHFKVATFDFGHPVLWWHSNLHHSVSKFVSWLIHKTLPLQWSTEVVHISCLQISSYDIVHSMCMLRNYISRSVLFWFFKKVIENRYFFLLSENESLFCAFSN